MANDLIEAERIQSSLDSFDPKKHLSNPQEESFEDEDSLPQLQEAKSMIVKSGDSAKLEEDGHLEHSQSNPNLIQLAST